MIYNRIPVAFGGSKKITGPTISYQYDVTQVLVITGLALPTFYEVDFCNEGDAQSITMVGTADGVAIPDEFLQTGKKVKAYIVVQGEDEGAVETRYEITIPVNPRPRRTDIEPTPAEQLQIDELVADLNEAVARAEGAAQFAEESEAWAVGERGGEPVSQDDETYQNNAKFYSELAQQGADQAGWVKFYIDESGNLHYVKTANADLDFYIDSNGNLHVTNGA